jgi:hypothetical protein
MIKPVSHAAIPIIDPHSVFTVSTLREVLGLRQGSLPCEIRQKRLKAHKRCGRYFILGSDVLAWIEGAAQSRGQRGAISGDGNGAYES